MSHSLTGRCATPGDKRNNRQWVIVRKILSSLFLGTPTDLSDQNNALRFFIFGKHLKAIAERGAVDRISTNANRSRLAKTNTGELVNRFIGKRPTSRDNTNDALLMHETRHDASLAFARRNNTGAVRTDHPGATIEAIGQGLNHIKGRNTLSNT